jgi:DHA1 family purine ribonucleoside efflux pump-like MFS transporter
VRRLCAISLAPPLGSFFGELIGWRGVFAFAAGLSVACFVWQALVLPAMPAPVEADGRGVLAVARRPQVGVAMLAIFCVFAGQFAFFTYVRPFYERVAHFDVRALSAVLLAFGVANCLGTWLSAAAIRRSLRLTLILAPLIMAVSGGGLYLFGSHAAAAGFFTIVWGFMFGWVPVSWSTWIARNIGDDAENAGGLQVAVIQGAAAIGAAAGGYIIDAGGPATPIGAAAAVLLIATLTIVVGLRRSALEKQ